MNKTNKGFSLIELLVVVFIIALLAGIFLVNWTGAKAKSRDLRRMSDMSAIADALAMYYSDNKAYPTSNDKIGAGLVNCNSSGSGEVIDGTDCLTDNDNLKIYIETIPLDPKSPAENYLYWPRQVSGAHAGAGWLGFGYTLLAECEGKCADGFKWGGADSSYGGLDGYYALTSSVE